MMRGVALTITQDQQRDIDRARAFLAAAAAEDRNVLATHLGEDNPDLLYAAALGAARVQLANLLAVIDSLTGGA